MILETDVIRHASWLRGVQTAVSEGYSSINEMPSILVLVKNFLVDNQAIFNLSVQGFSTHRGHLPYLTLDGDLRAYIADFTYTVTVFLWKSWEHAYKVTNHGHITSVPIVGSSIPLLLVQLMLQRASIGLLDFYCSFW